MAIVAPDVEIVRNNPVILGPVTVPMPKVTREMTRLAEKRFLFLTVLCPGND